MAMRLASFFAAKARVPVFCLLGDGERQARRIVQLDRRLRLVNSPRHAAILLLAGRMVPAMASAIRHVHDQLPEPRGVVLWRCPEGENLFTSTALVTSNEMKVPTDTIVALYHQLLEQKQSSSPLFGPSQNPVQWQGEGDHGQGGEGMMGGTPYGRSMGMTGEDVRDGLQLGSTRLSLGPFLPWMPPGLSLSLTLQGDVIQQLRCQAMEFTTPDVDQVFLRAATEPAPLSAIELARARHHLRVVADLLFLLELDDYGRRALQLAETVAAGLPEPVQRFTRSLRYGGLFCLSTRGIGRVSTAMVPGFGPVARAAGLGTDAREGDPAYQGLDFTVLTRVEGDAAAICTQRLAETVQALQLAGRAAERIRRPGPPVEGPRGALPEGDSTKNGAGWQQLIEEQARGMTWDAFVTLLVSLDLDPAGLPPGKQSEDADNIAEGSH